ncbi:SDR family NAD(P)-dependent oxidoreductase [Allosaccharopolyspora coralli]|uniref:SDR family NAD(P)-dependent oxidoreductase n=1 Tax=Allosaccharopolyspora coralli TaxID=2665642 RepID=A0A5Q3QHY1_9PSEU|nr:SDR family NAD(P)-dependent oxidoreductase [Allosaccharopolyspora coralli]QGK70447.1 SDR family NAD(P)-dependent oxidoreductase [Allosaccharopolyspora coralli]
MKLSQRLPASCTDFLDRLADTSVVVGYTELGARLRRAGWSQDDPEPGALRNAIAVVTGGSSGLGEATAVGLARLGATVVLLVRDLSRGEQARERIRSEAPNADIVLERCDVSDLADVRRCSGELRSRYTELHVLVHNAGVLPAHRTESVDGHEITLATHVLGPLLLTEELRPCLRNASSACVVWVSSGGMYTQSLPEDPEYREGQYRGATAYARTKRLQVAFTPLLARRYRTDGIRVHAMHPGWVDTPGVAESLPGFRRVTEPLLRDPHTGADTVVWLAGTTPSPEGGRFWHDRRPRPMHYLPWQSDDPESLRRLWKYCARESGVQPS